MMSRSLFDCTDRVGMGCDPEFFLYDRTLGRLVSAHTIVPGDKRNPHRLEKGAIQVDGLAVEYNIDPAYNAKDFVSNNNAVLAQIRRMIPRNYEFVYRPSVLFDEMYYEKLDAKPKELGCDPDFNAAYEGQQNAPEENKQMPNLRTGAGHIHLSWTKDKEQNDPSHRWDCNLVGKTLANIFRPYIKTWDQDVRREYLYGNAYAIRYKPYGMEWRHPSNAWLNHPELWEWIYNSMTLTVKKIKAGDLDPIFTNERNLSYTFPQYYFYGNIRSQEHDNFKQWQEFVHSRFKDFPEMPKIEEHL